MTPLTELLIALCEVTVNNNYEMSTQPMRDTRPESARSSRRSEPEVGEVRFVADN